MNQKVRESLSAVMDGEGDELELRRMLKSLEKSPAEADTWRRYHIVGSVLRRDRDIDVTCDLSASIRERIEAQPLVEANDAEVAGSTAVARRHGGPFSFMGNAAVAAAVSLMVITGVQVYRGTGTGGGETAGQAASPSGVSASPSGGPIASGGDLSTVGFSAESANQQPYGGRQNADLFPVYSQDGSADPDSHRQARALRGFLDQHAQSADGQQGVGVRF